MQKTIFWGICKAQYDYVNYPYDVFSFTSYAMRTKSSKDNLITFYKELVIYFGQHLIALILCCVIKKYPRI